MTRKKTIEGRFKDAAKITELESSQIPKLKAEIELSDFSRKQKFNPLKIINCFTFFNFYLYLLLL